MLAKAILSAHIGDRRAGEVVPGTFRYRISSTSAHWIGIAIRWVTSDTLRIENDDFTGAGLEEVIDRGKLVQMVRRGRLITWCSL